MNHIELPRRRKGRQSEAARQAFNDALRQFAARIAEINSTLDFRVSSRGWCYMLEELAGLEKGEFDYAQKLIGDCRKSGLLPMDICAEDSARSFSNLEQIDNCTPEQYANRIKSQLPLWANDFDPVSFWDNQPVYIQMVVEKIDLHSLFNGICEEHHIPLANARGWGDITMRARIKERFAEWESCGKQCILAYCGDHDPAGLSISDHLRNNLDEIAAVPWDSSDLIIDRFGLNCDFIEENDLPWIDNLITGSGENLASTTHKHHKYPYVQNYLAEYGVRKCEANALVIRPEAGRQLCLDAINEYIDQDAKAEFEEYTSEQRARARDLLTL